MARQGSALLLQLARRQLQQQQLSGLPQSLAAGCSTQQYRCVVCRARASLRRDDALAFCTHEQLRVCLTLVLLSSPLHYTIASSAATRSPSTGAARRPTPRCAPAAAASPLPAARRKCRSADTTLPYPATTNKQKQKKGTEFLGTPPDHQALIQKRPLSPDVFELDGKHMHYKMPLGALSSIANRVTGVALSAGFAAAGYVALTGDLPGALAAFKANHPVLVYPIKVGLWLYWLLCLLLCGVSCGVSVCFPHAPPCPQKTHTHKKNQKKGRRVVPDHLPLPRRLPPLCVGPAQDRKPGRQEQPAGDA